MTLTDVVNQLYNLSGVHQFNGEVFSYQRLYTQINKAFKGSNSPYYILVKLSDREKEWLVKIIKRSNKADSFDYIVPDDENKEKYFYKELYKQY